MPEDLDRKLQKLNDNHDKTVVAPASQSRVLQVPRFQTGVFELDHVLGGGVPRGRVLSIWGQTSTGKTTIATLMAQAAQKTCRYCLEPIDWDFETNTGDCGTEGCESEPMRVGWFDPEGTFDNEWAESLGAYLDDYFYVIRTETMEEGINTMDAMLRSKDLDFLVVDSIAAMAPEREIRDPAQDDAVGVAARKMNQACRKWQSSIVSSGMDEILKPTILLVNQVRMKVGVMYGDPKTRPGGKGQEFASSIDLFTYSTDETSFDGSAVDDSVGTQLVEIDFKSKKNKTFRSNIRTQITVATMDSPDGDIEKGDIISDNKRIFDLSRDYGMIEKDGNDWVWVPTGEIYGTYTELREETDIDTVYDEVLEAVLCGKWVPPPEPNDDEEEMGDSDE